MLRMVAAPLERRIGAGAMARLYAVADQGAMGLGNIVAFALLGRELPVGQFGAIGMMVGLHYFIAGFHRSGIVLPFTTDDRASVGEAAAHAENSGWWWLGLIVAIALSLATAFAALGVNAISPRLPGWAWAVEPLLLAAIVSPAMLAWEFARRWLYKVERSDVVAVASTFYFIVLCLGAWAASVAAPTARIAALAWVAASVAAMIVALPALRPAMPNKSILSRLYHTNRSHSAWLATTNLPYSVYSNATIVVLIGILIGPVAAAVFTAARTLTNPAISLISAIDSLDKPRAARALAHEGLGGLRRVVARSRRSITVVTAAYLGAVALFATPLIAFVFKGEYAGLETEVRLLALGFFLFGLNLPSETMLIVLRASRTMLVLRTVTAAATLVALIVGARWGVSGMAIAYALTQALNYALLHLAEGVAARRHERNLA